MNEGAVRVRVPSKSVDIRCRMLEWCIDTCPNYITNTAEAEAQRELDYVFVDFWISCETERAMFKIVWGEYVA